MLRNGTALGFDCLNDPKLRSVRASSGILPRIHRAAFELDGLHSPVLLVLRTHDTGHSVHGHLHHRSATLDPRCKEGTGHVVVRGSWRYVELAAASAAELAVGSVGQVIGKDELEGNGKHA
mmetsp:Transcript_27662/g.34206  ORF Transcript_27662/g.34206 Transcript_27662/m.34206 type:complete len:121 (-) Transcript_27662:144-506(-)